MMCFCFESQFDSCIMDRPIIVNTIRLLTTQLPDENMLTFDFFIQRFETLVLESQLVSQSEDTMFVQDLMHTDPMSEIYQRKVNKAKKTIEEASIAKSIVRYLREYNALKHQLCYQPSEPPGTFALFLAYSIQIHRNPLAILAALKRTILFQLQCAIFHCAIFLLTRRIS
ncbi:hypothetical protein COOONC_23550 [Cooperia oncophora]